MNKALRKQVKGLQAGIMGAAEQNPLPQRFTVDPVSGKPFVRIHCLSTGKLAEVPLFAYGEVRKVLSAFY
jgi:hypothetical protein